MSETVPLSGQGEFVKIIMSMHQRLLILFVIALTGCAGHRYQYREPFPELERSTATTASVGKFLGPPAKISRSSHVSKEGPPTDMAYRYYFATRDGDIGAKIFYFHKEKWVGENVLGGKRRDDFYRLLDPNKALSKKMITEFEKEHPHLW